MTLILKSGNHSPSWPDLGCAKTLAGGRASVLLSNRPQERFRRFLTQAMVAWTDAPTRICSFTAFLEPQKKLGPLKSEDDF
jgi:hypothetical protein